MDVEAVERKVVCRYSKVAVNWQLRASHEPDLSHGLYTEKKTTIYTCVREIWWAVNVSPAMRVFQFTVKPS